MELNWSTFLLEIINFLVLVWILKHFLYRPVLSVLEKRRQSIAQTLADADQHHREATELEQTYKQRLEAWEREKQQLREVFQQDLQNEKTQRSEQLVSELTDMREKAAIIDQRQQTEKLRQLQKNAHQQGARFASRILSQVASAELENRLFDLLITLFDQLDTQQIQTLTNACKSLDDRIIITSAYPLSDAKCRQLEQKLYDICDQDIAVHYLEDASLLAGLRIVIGASVLNLNLKDELSSFAELSHDNG